MSGSMVNNYFILSSKRQIESNCFKSDSLESSIDNLNNFDDIFSENF